MEKICRLAAGIKSRYIIAFSALALIAVFAVKGFVGYTMENIARANETLEQSRLEVSDFEQVSMKQDGESLVSTDADPQLILNVNRKMTNIKFYMETSLYPGEIVVYYTTDPRQGFSENKRLWAVPVSGESGWYAVDLGIKDVISVRIDPTIYAGNEMTFGTFVLNEEKTLSDYLSVAPSDIFNLLLYTGIISSLLRLLQEIFTKKFE